MTRVNFVISTERRESPSSVIPAGAQRSERSGGTCFFCAALRNSRCPRR